MSGTKKQLKSLNLKSMLSDIGEPIKEVGKDLGGTVKKGLGLEKPDDPVQLTAPTPDDLTRQKAKQREMQRKYSKSGRAGTMLTDGDSKLG